MCVCVRCLLCTLSFRTTKEQPSHLKCVQRSHVSGGRRLSFKPARCWFASPLDFQFLWWPQRCLTPQVRRTWKGRVTKGAGQFMRTCVSEPERTHPRPHRPSPARRRSRRVVILKRSGCLLRSCTASRRLCVSRQFSANLCYDANNAASAAYVGQLRQTKKGCKTGMFMHYYQDLT